MNVDFAEFLLAAMPSPAARIAALGVLARFAGCTVYLPVQGNSKRRQRVAQDLLDAGRAPAEVVEILRARFGISARTAYRDVKTQREMS